MSSHDSFLDHTGADPGVLMDPAVDPGFGDPTLDDPCCPDPGSDAYPDPAPGFEVDPAHHPGPVDETAWWHQQAEPKSCAIASQEFVLDELTGVDHSESELREVALEHGWYSEDGGTPVADTGKLLEYYGVHTEQHEHVTMDQLEASLAGGQGVIVGVDSGEIWNPGQDPDDVVGEHLGVPGEGADHAVQVTAVDRSDPANPVVVLNDPGTPDGAGERVPLAVFEGAWEDSGNFMVTADPPGSGGSGSSDGTSVLAGGPSLGTSYTVDGTTDSGHSVEWSTSTNAYHDQSTWEEVTPR